MACCKKWQYVVYRRGGPGDDPLAVFRRVALWKGVWTCIELFLTHNKATGMENFLLLTISGGCDSKIISKAFVLKHHSSKSYGKLLHLRKYCHC